MKRLRNFLRKWLAVPEPTQELTFEPKVEHGKAELAAFDAAEIVTIYENGLAEPCTIAALCREYGKEHVFTIWHGRSVDLSHNRLANKRVAHILAQVELTMATENLAAAKKRAKEVA